MSPQALYEIVLPLFWTCFVLAGTRIGQNPPQMVDHLAWILRLWSKFPRESNIFSQKEFDCPSGTSIRQSKTRTTRTPAFWGYPHRLMITHSIESYWIPSQKKTKSKFQIWRIRQNFIFSYLETNITRDTPSEVAWWDVQIWNGSDEYRPVSQMRAPLGGSSRTSGKLWQDYSNCYMFWTWNAISFNPCAIYPHCGILAHQ